jgi:Sec-independent protein translocase protein TatA
VFGAGKLPSVGRSLGEGIRALKRGLEGESEEEKKIKKEETKKEVGDLPKEKESGGESSPAQVSKQ